MVLTNDNILDIQNDVNIDFISKISEDRNNLIIDPYEDIVLSSRYMNVSHAIQVFKQKTGLKTLSWNIRSLQRNFEQLVEFIDFFASENCFFDIIAIQEIWCIKNADCFNLPNYNLVFKSREKSNGGGIGYFILKDYSFKIKEELSIFEEKVIESLTIELELNKKEKIFFTNIYRCNTHHSTLTETQQIDKFLDIYSNIQAELSLSKNDSYIMGDFNFNLLNFNNHLKTNEFLDLNFSKGS